MEWWYYVEKDREIGPVPKEEFDSLVNIGKIQPTTMVWREGLESWKPYGALSGDPNAAALLANAVRCQECRKMFAPDDVIRYRDFYICAGCKPIFFQRLKEGLSLPGAFQYAPFWSRVWAKIIDGVLIWIVDMALGTLWAVFMVRFLNEQQTLFFILYFLLFMIEIAISLAYSVYFTGKFAATPGKMALGIKVVMADGTPVTYGMAFKRFFAELLSAFTLYIGYLIAAWDEECRALHDRICDTRVVRR